MGALLAFATSKLGILTIAGLLVAALVAGIYVQGLRLDVSQAAEAAERSRADANAAVVKAMQADAERANRIVADYAAEIARYQEAARDTRNAIVAAPVTAACVGSPAIRSLLQGVRREAGK